MWDTVRAWRIAVPLLLTLPISAQAQSVQDVFRNFGLIGVWASACNQPPDIESGSPQAIYARSSSDDVMLTYDYGAKHRAAVYTIVSAQQAGSNQVSYGEEWLHDEARFTVTVLQGARPDQRHLGGRAGRQGFRRERQNRRDGPADAAAGSLLLIGTGQPIRSSARTRSG